ELTKCADEVRSWSPPLAGFSTMQRGDPSSESVRRSVALRFKKLHHQKALAHVEDFRNDQIFDRLQTLPQKGEPLLFSVKQAWRRLPLDLHDAASASRQDHLPCLLHVPPKHRTSSSPNDPKGPLKLGNPPHARPHHRERSASITNAPPTPKTGPPRK